MARGEWLGKVDGRHAYSSCQSIFLFFFFFFFFSICARSFLGEFVFRGAFVRDVRRRVRLPLPGRVHLVHALRLTVSRGLTPLPAAHQLGPCVIGRPDSGPSAPPRPRPSSLSLHPAAPARGGRRGCGGHRAWDGGGGGEEDGEGINEKRHSLAVPVAFSTSTRLPCPFAFTPARRSLSLSLTRTTPPTPPHRSLTAPNVSSPGPPTSRTACASSSG